MITLNNLTVAYNKHPAIHHINACFDEGSLTAIAGPNGSGKSTLLKALMGIIKPTEGSITLGDIKKDEIAYLPQVSKLNKDFPLTVLQLVLLGFWGEFGGKKSITKAHKKQALEAIKAVGMEGFEQRSLASLSSGQFQRILFARVLLQDPKLVLLDEPFSAIDVATTEKLLVIVKQWHKQKRTVICVLHDVEQIKKHFPNCMLISRQCIDYGKSDQTLTTENLQKAINFKEYWNENASFCNV